MEYALNQTFLSSNLLSMVKLYSTRISSTYLGCWMLHLVLCKWEVAKEATQILEDSDLTFSKGIVIDSVAVDSSHL